MPDLGFLFKVSRPRFWFYVFGPYIVGLVSGATIGSDLVGWQMALFALYFLFPANLLIYGVNDIFDFDTDAINEKKVEYELLVAREKHKKLIFWIVILNLPLLIVAVVLAPQVIPALAGFLFFSTFYSAPPIRAKSIPFLDSAFNILYLFPGILGFQLMTGYWPPLTILIAAGCWTAAMHAYSAIPDIVADRNASVHTIATLCGPYLTLAISAVLYAAAAFFSLEYLGFVSVSLGAAYVLLMLTSVWSYKEGRLFKLYRAFPMINLVAGFVLFWEIALRKF